MGEEQNLNKIELAVKDFRFYTVLYLLVSDLDAPLGKLCLRVDSKMSVVY